MKQLTLGLDIKPPELELVQVEEEAMIQKFADGNSCQTLTKDTLRKTFPYKGRTWACVGSMSDRYVKLYELIRPEDWGKSTHSYNSPNTSWDEFYTGQLVKHRKEIWVMGELTIAVRSPAYDRERRDA